MIEMLTDLPDGTIGIRLSGKVESEDYKQTLDPAVDAALKDHDRINALVVFDGDVDYTAGAAWQDTKLGLSHPLSWRRIALVAEPSGWDRMVPVISALMPGQVKTFPPAEIDAARAWVAEPEPKTEKAF